jgi:hypothetical protein
MIHWLSGPWTWIVPLLIFIGLPLLAALVVVRLSARRAVLAEVEKTPEPETAQEQTTIEPASGELLPPDVRLAIGGARWGRPVRRRYVPEEYDGPIACLLCGRPVLPGQFFWETPLISRETGEETGEAFQLCLSCQPGDVAAVIHRGP